MTNPSNEALQIASGYAQQIDPLTPNRLIGSMEDISTKARMAAEQGQVESAGYRRQAESLRSDPKMVDRVGELLSLAVREERLSEIRRGIAAAYQASADQVRQQTQQAHAVS